MYIYIHIHICKSRNTIVINNILLYYTQIKKMVRSGKNPLMQIINRIEEIQSLFPVEDIIKTKSVGLKHPNNINEYKEFICRKLMIILMLFVKFIQMYILYMTSITLLHITSVVLFLILMIIILN